MVLWYLYHHSPQSVAVCSKHVCNSLIKDLHFCYSVFYSALFTLAWKQCWIYPIVWKLAENYHDNSIPAKYTLDLQDMPEDHQYLKFCLINNSHWSADWTQRSRLFICVETNSWWRVVSSIAFAVSRVNSGQFLSGSFISIRGHYLYLRWKCLLSSPSSCT